MICDDGHIAMGPAPHRGADTGGCRHSHTHLVHIFFTEFLSILMSINSNVIYVHNFHFYSKLKNIFSIELSGRVNSQFITLSIAEFTFSMLSLSKVLLSPTF